jgi:hypothetical protein
MGIIIVKAILWKLRRKSKENRFALNPFQIRCKTVASPFLRIGEKWDLQGNYIRS